MGILKDKVAIVTGASRGIGKSIAQVFAREGAKVVICGRKQETLDQVAREIGAGVKPVACHVGKLDQMEALVDSITSEFGRIDILVNNAATTIAPGLIQTVLSEYFWKDEGRQKEIIGRQPIRHLGQPEEIAEVALLLASDRSSYMTGQTVVVDGGSILR